MPTQILQRSVPAYCSQAFAEQVERPCGDGFIVLPRLSLKQHGEQHKCDSFWAVGEREFHGLPVCEWVTPWTSYSRNVTKCNKIHGYELIKRFRSVPLRNVDIDHCFTTELPRRAIAVEGASDGAACSSLDCGVGFGWPRSFLRGAS